MSSPGIGSSRQTLTFTLNGAPTELRVRPKESLLEVLRERCGVIAPKDGCSPQGQCGACLVLVDGKPKVACAVPSRLVEGKNVLTLEGLEVAEKKLFGEAFVAAAGLQCGYCIPGIVMRAKWLLDKNPDPTRTEIAKAIDGNLCRCTGYTKVLDAIELAAKAKRTGEPIDFGDPSGRVGTSYRRYEGIELTLGARLYVADMKREGMLHGAVLMSAHPRARVLAIDTSVAKQMPGVASVLTAEDVPGNPRYGLLYADWPGMVSVGEVTHCVGTILACVAAEDRHTAREAAQAIRVDYEVLEPVTDSETAMQDDAPQVHFGRPNLLSRSFGRLGDPDAAFAECAHVVQHTFQTQRIEHLYLEPEAAMAEPDGAGGVLVYSPGQGVFDDRRQVASFLGLPEEKVWVRLITNGGAFGGKEDMSVQAHAALLALQSGRPVKVVLSREESIRSHPKRHPIGLDYKVGCDAEGNLKAVKVRIVGDTGAYASVGPKVVERAAGHVCGAYRVSNVEVEAFCVYTNNPPSGAMRGFGANQAQFAMEVCVDMLAEKVGLDGWEMRYKNALEIGDTYSSGQVLEKSVGIKKTLLAVKDAFYSSPYAGIACGIKNAGVGNGAVEYGKARIVVNDDATATIFNGYTEMGQGLFTILIQTAVEVTGLPPSVFRAGVDTTYALACGQTTGSRGTMWAGQATRKAAAKLRADLDAGQTLGDLVGRIYEGEHRVDDTTKLGAELPPGKKIKTHSAFGFATQVAILNEEGRLIRVVAAHDVGKAMNPALCEGQIEGSIHMGLGFALTEELSCPGGVPETYKLRKIGVLRARDMPAIDVILVEDPEPEGPFGAKGVGEIGLVPTAGAVANALFRFDGIRRFTLPMRDSAAAKAMSVGE